MKLFKITSILIISILLFSCDDESTQETDGTEQQEYNGNFFPLTVADTWNYDVENTDNSTNDVTPSQDVLTVESESTTGFTLSVNQGGVANGTMSGILTSGELTRTETTLAANGTIGLPIDGFDFEIQLDNALLYNTQANNGQQLSEKTGTFSQDLQGYPISIDYTLKSKQLENLSSLTVDGTIYDIVTSANITLELSVYTEISVGGFTQVISILDPQEVLSVDSFYAKNIGLINAEADSGYTLNPNTVSILQQLGVDLSMLPTSLSVTNTQVLTSYTITE
ncbi:hypothetical protein [Olleya sp. R77988]|uniref:hypothetical protein n=1 Tax=Olleya sp. R77988 TaxID=3093875 RepID=UPI0037C53F34